MKNLFLFFLLMLLGCEKKTSKGIAIKKQPSELNIVKNNPEPIALDTFSIKKITNWKQYWVLKNFIIGFKNISANGALNNALQLNEIVKKLKDSIKPKILITPAFKARIDVLENETLRLVDMTYISAITADEVNNEITKILAIYSGINQKISTLFYKKKFEDAINVTHSFIGLDSTKIDGLSKKPVIGN